MTLETQNLIVVLGIKPYKMLANYLKFDNLTLHAAAILIIIIIIITIIIMVYCRVSN